MKEADDLIALTRALIAETRGADITQAEWTAGGFSLKIERQVTGAATRGDTADRSAARVERREAPADVATGAAPGHRVMVRSPMHGIFYAAPDQAASPFVAVGDAVVEGQVLCVIEAMKVFTKLAAEFNGTVVAISPSNGQEIAPGDILFEIAPNVGR